MAHGDAGETQADIRTRAVQREGRDAGVGAIFTQGNLVGQADDIVQQCTELAGFCAVIEGRDDLERLGDLFEVGLQLGLEIGIQHDSRFLEFRQRGARGGWNPAALHTFSKRKSGFVQGG
ncbi:hypothetical protein D3C81_1471710 [compost metagenome]